MPCEYRFLANVVRRHRKPRQTSQPGASASPRAPSAVARYALTRSELTPPLSSICWPMVWTQVSGNPGAIALISLRTSLTTLPPRCENAPAVLHSTHLRQWNVEIRLRAVADKMKRVPDSHLQSDPKRDPNPQRCEGGDSCRNCYAALPRQYEGFSGRRGLLQRSLIQPTRAFDPADARSQGENRQQTRTARLKPKACRASRWSPPGPSSLRCPRRRSRNLPGERQERRGGQINRRLHGSNTSVRCPYTRHSCC